MAKSKNSNEKGFSFLLMFVAGFAGFSILGAAILFTLISLGILPAI